MIENSQKILANVRLGIASCERDQDLMQDIVHMQFFDLIAFCYLPKGRKIQYISYSHIQSLNITSGDLLKAAETNTWNAGFSASDYNIETKKLFPPEEWRTRTEINWPLLITGPKRIFGAIVLLYPDYFASFAKEDLWIFPISVNEISAMPASMFSRPRAISMAAISGQAFPDLFLSSHLYRYNLRHNRITVI